jgi:restriction system protein
MSIPDFQSLMLPVLRNLADHQWRVSDLVKAISDESNLTEEERHALQPGGQNRIINNRVGWALTNLKKAGLIESPAHAKYMATELGRKVLSTKPAQITISYLRQIPGVSVLPDSTLAELPDSTQTGTPVERLIVAEQELKTELADELLDRTTNLHWSDFERLAVALLGKLGYDVNNQTRVKPLGGVGDGGVDGVILRDEFGFDSIFIQAKKYANNNPVGAPAIQSFAGALLSNGATKGVFITTSRFTAQARDTALGYKSHRIVLIDGPELVRLMIKHEIGVRTTQTVKVQEVNLEAYEADVTA